MMNASAQALDIELTPHDLQALNGAEAVASFFARLGYDIDLRTPQTPGNLGITAESTARPIKKIELLASQENLFQVYLFELTSVTVAHTRALARAFRNRAGNYLLVLTSDYENLDFVLLEKYLPSDKGNGASIAQKQVGIRPRVLTVERRKPSRIHLRVLRRFTWTESDPFAQYDKLLSAYAVADWSEEYFNNRALFSDYYLKERLRELPEWIEDPKPAYLALRQLYQGASAKFSGLEIPPFRQALLEPLFQLLGFSVKPGKIAGTSAPNPHYRLLGADAGAPLALCLAYPWARSLDGKDDQRDKTSPEENPSARVVSLLEQGEVPWVMVTNGKLWRLYSARTHSRATNYYEIDLEEVLAGLGPGLGDPAESFRYFWLLFRRQAFETLEIEREGKKIQSTFLDRLLLESEDYAKELGERLKERVFEEIFPHLAAGFIAHIRAQEGDQADLSQPRLDKIFQGTLTLLYRLLFLLYAEARLLLPVRETRGYFEISLDKIKKEVAEAAGDIADEVDGCLKKRYRHDLNEIYERLNRLFQAVDLGDAALNVPIYNGGLFISNPDPLEQSPEAQNSRFLQAHKVPDRYLALALDCMARDLDSKRHDLVFIDYKSLGVRQLGSIYEGLLEFKLRIADRKLAIVKEKSREVYKPLSELEDAQKSRVEKSGRIIKKGAVYLENDKRERKATGSYYTPDHIVKYIVENAVGPVLQERFEQLRPKLRQAQVQRREFFKRQEALLKQGLRPEPDSKADLVGRELVEEFFRVKVLDPAMGSGHFLVEAVDFITDKALDFLNAFPWNPIIARLEEMRRTILKEMDDQGITIDAGRLTDVNLLKRQVLKGCIYGVDLNPMAVELAKVSLWLDCFTLGAPLSFLDHHLRCGNSLIGVTVKEVQEALQEGQMKLFGSQFAGLLLATETMRQVGEISDITSAQVRESRREYCKAAHMLAQFKRILDVYTSQWFGNTPYKRSRGKNSVVVNPALEFLKGDESESWLKDPTGTAGLSDFGKQVATITLAVAREKRFFHWELEFPEIFYGPRPGTIHAIERLEGAGFDAIIGNPPWGATIDDADKNLKDCYSLAQGQYDSYELFIERSFSIVKPNGYWGMIIPDSILKPEHQPLRNFIGGRDLRSALRIGEGIFEDVFRASMVIIARSWQVDESDLYQTISLNKEHRAMLEAGSASLNNLVLKEGGNRKIKEGWDNQGFQLFLGKKSIEEDLLNVISKKTLKWDDICEDFRGVEFSQTGTIIICAKCGMGNPPPRKRKGVYREKSCDSCDEKLRINENTLKIIVAATPTEFKSARPFIQGEDVNRYSILISQYIDTNIKGINFKEDRIYYPPKILIRKTGFGIYASIDNSDAIVPQAVYIFRLKNKSIPYSLEYILGVLNSRLALYYYVKRTGESEWKSFPYITQKVIKEIPLPIINWENDKEKEMHSQLTEMVRQMISRPTYEIDLEIEHIVWSLFKLPFELYYPEVEKFLTTKVQALRIIREMFPSEIG